MVGTEYQICVSVLDAADFGVPQHRRRLFVVGSRDGRLFSFPKPTHFAPDDSMLPLPHVELFRTAWDALAEGEEDPNDPELQATGKWADLLPSIPEGTNYLYHTERGGGIPLFGWRTRFWNFLLKLAKSRPSWTITAQPGPATGPFHWANRRLSRRELCRLQTFPDSYTIAGNLRSVQRQLGNAVPCALAQTLGREIRKQLLDDATDLGELKLLPEKQGAVPVPENTAPVPAKYLDRMGDHADHPGRGKGPRALEWTPDIVDQL